MLIRVAGAALFGWSRSRLFGLAPIPTLNILFLRDPTGNYESMSISMSMTLTMTMTMTTSMTN